MPSRSSHQARSAVLAATVVPGPSAPRHATATVDRLTRGPRCPPNPDNMVMVQHVSQSKVTEFGHGSDGRRPVACESTEELHSSLHFGYGTARPHAHAFPIQPVHTRTPLALAFIRLHYSPLFLARPCAGTKPDRSPPSTCLQVAALHGRVCSLAPTPARCFRASASVWLVSN